MTRDEKIGLQIILGHVIFFFTGVAFGVWCL